MSKENDVYLDTVSRMEPDIHKVDPGAFYASAAISLKRIAESLEFFRVIATMAIEQGEETDSDVSAVAKKLREEG
jgi:hypothetical protein